MSPEQLKEYTPATETEKSDFLQRRLGTEEFREVMAHVMGRPDDDEQPAWLIDQISPSSGGSQLELRTPENERELAKAA